MAAIAIPCSRCSDAFRVISSQAGKKVRCPHCGAVNAISEAAFARAQETAGARFEATSEPPATAQATFSDEVINVAAAVQQSDRRAALAAVTRSRMAYTHSALAQVASLVARILFIIAIAIETYVIIMTEWRSLAKLPAELAIPTFAATFLPAGAVALTGLTLLVSAHGLEFLARISAARTGR